MIPPGVSLAREVDDSGSDACGKVIDRDAIAALSLAAPTAASGAGTGVAREQDIAPAVSKSRGVGQKTRITRPGHNTRPVRAGCAIPQQRKEVRDCPERKRSRVADVTFRDEMPGMWMP